MINTQASKSLSSAKSRRLVLGLITACWAVSFFWAAEAQQQNAPTVLFVCQFGSVKSAIAREVFVKRAKERGISATAMSRGITPEPHMSPALHERLAAERIDPDRQPLTGLTAADASGANIVVIFDKLP